MAEAAFKPSPGQLTESYIITRWITEKGFILKRLCFYFAMKKVQFSFYETAKVRMQLKCCLF